MREVQGYFNSLYGVAQTVDQRQAYAELRARELDLWGSVLARKGGSDRIATRELEISQFVNRPSTEDKWISLGEVVPSRNGKLRQALSPAQRNVLASTRHLLCTSVSQSGLTEARRSQRHAHLHHQLR